MLRRIGTEKEITQEIIQALPVDVGRELLRSTIILDYEYGRDRNYLSRGGYSFLAETTEDVAAIGEVIDFDTHPCEWAYCISGYIVSLFLLNDDFSVVTFIPKAICPQTILEDVEDPND